MNFLSFHMPLCLIRSSLSFQDLQMQILVVDYCFKMPPKGDKRAFHSVSPDIISNLPDIITDDILKYLPLRDVVRTSILSKKWRYKWCKLPELILDQTLWEPRSVSITTLTFAKAVCHLLIRHEGPITKFSLAVPDRGCWAITDNLIYFLSKKNIQYLVLQLPNCFPYYKLPASFFTCLQLRHLTLKNCLLSDPPDFKGFDKLIGLELCEVLMNFKFLENLISHSPLLKYLVLETLYDLSDFEITAPNLKSFDFQGDGNSISLKNTPLLEKLSLANVDLFVEPGKCGISMLFESCPALKQLHLDHSSLQLLFARADEVPKQLPVALNSLQQLHLYHICGHQSTALHAALCLIRNCPYLQNIEIQIDEDCTCEDRAVGSLAVDCFSDMTLNHLRAVKLEGIRSTPPLMAFIKLLLAVSPVLVRTLIEPGQIRWTLKTRFKLLAELTKFPRASPKAEVVYNFAQISV